MKEHAVHGDMDKDRTRELRAAEGKCTSGAIGERGLSRRSGHQRHAGPQGTDLRTQCFEPCCDCHEQWMAWWRADVCGVAMRGQSVTYGSKGACDGSMTGHSPRKKCSCSTARRWGLNITHACQQATGVVTISCTHCSGQTTACLSMKLHAAACAAACVATRSKLRPQSAA